MFIGDIWIDGAPTQFYFLFIPPIFSLLIWLIELQNTQYVTLRVIHIIFCWFSLFDIFIIEFLIWSLRGIERIMGPKQFQIFLFHNLLIYIPCCIITNIFAPKSICLPLGYFYPFSLFIFMLVYIPSTSMFLIVHDKLIVTLGFILIIAVYLPYSLIPLISSIIGTLIWSYDVFHLSKCATMPLEISDDDMVVIPSMRENRRVRSHNYGHNRYRSRSRHQGININIDVSNQSPYLLDPLNPAPNANLGEEETEEIEVKPEDIRQITEMGFEEDQARNALVRTRNNVQRAVEILLNPD